jgi:hypothetical protein
MPSVDRPRRQGLTTQKQTANPCRRRANPSHRGSCHPWTGLTHRPSWVRHVPLSKHGRQTTRDHGVLIIRKLIAWAFMYSLDGLLADEGTEYWQILLRPARRPGGPGAEDRPLPERVRPHHGPRRLRGHGRSLADGRPPVHRHHERRAQDRLLPDPLDLHPYVAGEGTRLFEEVPKSYRLDLVSSTEFSNGTVGLHYRRHR